jgi:hypothetical protein
MGLWLKHHVRKGVLVISCGVLRILCKLNLLKEEIDYNLLYEKERNTKTNHQRLSSLT